MPITTNLPNAHDAHNYPLPESKEAAPSHNSPPSAARRTHYAAGAPFFLFLFVDPFLRLHTHGHQLCRATTVKLLRPPPSRFVQPLPIPAPPRDFGCLPRSAIPGRISLLFPPTLQRMQSPLQRKNHCAQAHCEPCWVPVRTYRMGGLSAWLS
ncbi:hypothetical protein B0H14DRAFT_3445830 [Mycena olivaceomarginata]|nr:hypothetical protein B0H14DRAFT_3445830 [Mycena olivaceomarginata]